MILELPGKAMLSPTPSMMRSTSSEAKPPAKPIRKVLAAHSRNAAGHQFVDGEAIAQPAGEQLHRGVDPEEGREGDAEGFVGQAELALHQRRGDADRAAVDIIEEHRRAEQQDQRSAHGVAASSHASPSRPPPALSWLRELEPALHRRDQPADHALGGCGCGDRASAMSRMSPRARRRRAARGRPGSRRPGRCAHRAGR